MLAAPRQAEFLHHRVIHKVGSAGNGGQQPAAPGHARHLIGLRSRFFKRLRNHGRLDIRAAQPSAGRQSARSSSSPWRTVRTHSAPCRVYSPNLVEVDPGLIASTRLREPAPCAAIGSDCASASNRLRGLQRHEFTLPRTAGLDGGHRRRANASILPQQPLGLRIQRINTWVGAVCH